MFIKILYDVLFIDVCFYVPGTTHTSRHVSGNVNANSTGVALSLAPNAPKELNTTHVNRDRLMLVFYSIYLEIILFIGAYPFIHTSHLIHSRFSSIPIPS